MDLGGVERVGAVRQQELARKAADVSPAFAVVGARRMQDDSYGADTNKQDRGMEQDAEQEDGEENAEQVTTADSKRQVNLLA